MLEFDKTGEAGDSGPSFVLSKLATKEAVLFDGVVFKMPPHDIKENANLGLCRLRRALEWSMEQIEH